MIVYNIIEGINAFVQQKIMVELKQLTNLKKAYRRFKSSFLLMKVFPKKSREISAGICKIAFLVFRFT